MTSRQIIRFLVSSLVLVLLSACEYSSKYSESGGNVVAMTMISANHAEGYILGVGKLSIGGHEIEQKDESVLLDGKKIASNIDESKVEIIEVDSLLTVKVGQVIVKRQY
jgi:hypothetical protein